MWDGKKSTAFKVFYDAIDIIESKKQDAEKPSLEIWKDALTNVMPHVEVRSRRVGGATFKFNANSSRQKNFYGYEMVDSLRRRRKNQWLKD
jgi:ribosomal protein S7